MKMKTIMVRYKTAPEHAETNARLAREVYAQLRAQAPAGLRYATFRLADGVSFVHIASHEDPEQNMLTSLPAFKAFVEGIKARCVEAPVTSELSPVGWYGFDAFAAEDAA
jgi:hypothetical protein